MGSADNTESRSRTQSQTLVAGSITGSILLKAGQPGLQGTVLGRGHAKGNFKNLLLSRGNAQRTFRDMLPDKKWNGIRKAGKIQGRGGRVTVTCCYSLDV